MKTKDEIIDYVMRDLEGEYTNNPNDNGGETLWGVTKVAWQDYLNQADVSWPPYEFGYDEAKAVYEHFWDKMAVDYLPDNLQLPYFAFGFNAGYPTAIKLMQEQLGIKADGIVGPITRGSFQEIDDEESILFGFSSGCSFYYFRCNDFGHFGRGWINRLLKTLIY